MIRSLLWQDGFSSILKLSLSKSLCLNKLQLFLPWVEAFFEYFSLGKVYIFLLWWELSLEICSHFWSYFVAFFLYFRFSIFLYQINIWLKWPLNETPLIISDVMERDVVNDKENTFFSLGWAKLALNQAMWWKEFC